MPRVPRWLQLADAAAYHVLSRGHNLEAIFADPVAADFTSPFAADPEADSAL